MAEADVTQDGDAPAGAPPAQALDMTNIRGFQVLPVPSRTSSAAPDESAAPPLDDETRRRELAKEFAARAARLSEAVDDALVLANDGTIRWLGDPIAKLVAGEETLKPRALILADDALSEAGRELAQQRVALWLVAHIRRTIGPLLSLVDPESVPEGLRDLALKLSQSLGILERERVKAQVKALDQNARGAMRKLGVRFGAFYIYIPALLKPASRALCTQLWALVRGDAEKEAVAERLLHFASSGRTSFAAEPPALAEVYRVAGFRLCGDRAVRVDIVERLTDLIRAALPRHAPSETRDSTEEAGDGFVVTNQMTSLTGCSGEHFASILRSLGFANHKVKKAAFLAATRKAVADTKPIAPPPVQDESAGQPQDTSAAPTASLEELATPAAAEVEEPAPVEGEPPAPESPSADDAPPPEAAAPAPADENHERTVQDDTQAQAPETFPHAEEENPGEDELIEVWRPAPRRARHPGRDHGRPPRGGEVATPTEGRASPDASSRKPWRDRRHASGPSSAQPEAARPAEQSPQAGAEKPGAEPAREGRRAHWRRNASNKDSRGDERRTGEPPSGEKGHPRSPPPEHRKPTVNLDSPFAKLLDLKPLLKSRDAPK